MAVQGQADWGGGIFRAPGGPDGTVYDAINALVTDDRDLLKRGGLTDKASSNLATFIASLWDGYLIGGPRTAMLDSSSPAQVVVLDSDDTSIVHPDQDTVLGAPVSTSARGIAHQGVVFWPQPGKTFYLAYAGSKMTAPYSAGNIDVTNGSQVVTGHGTSFLTNVDVGAFVRVGAGISRPVASVDSDTQLTLKNAWDRASAAGTAYTINAVKEGNLDVDVMTGPTDGPVVFAAVNQRLVRAQNNRVHFSGLGNPFVFAVSDYWELPAGARVIGLDSFQDTCVVFTTSGVFAISNMDFDLTDDAGNVQQQLTQISKDMVLWADQGIAGWAGSLIVPALDDVYLLDSNGPQGVISEGIRPLYRDYVKAGYRPGIATVYRSHYFLPIVAPGGTVMDVLVCRLDLRDPRGNTRPAWTRWDTGALASAWAVRASTGAPKLLAAYNQRLREATDTFAPAAANKRDPSVATFDLDVTTRDLDTGGGNRNTVMAVKLRFELVDAASDNPTIAASYSEGPEGSAFTALTGSAPENDGTDPFTWRPVPPIRTRRLRLRLLSSGPSANLKIRVLELLVRSSSRL